MPLNDKQYGLIVYVEQEYLLNGAIPTADKVQELGLCTKGYYLALLENVEFREQLLARGITLKGGGKQDGILTEEQLTVANTMLDLTDNRSRKKKLADLQIATQKWEAWLRDPAFQHYLRTRAENILGDNQHEAHLALLDRVKSGDTGAIKFYYEITGRYVAGSKDSVDVPAILMRILEIIQKHVADGNTLAAIADEMLTLAAGVGIGQGSAPRVIDGATVKAVEGM